MIRNWSVVAAFCLPVFLSACAEFPFKKEIESPVEAKQAVAQPEKTPSQKELVTYQPLDKDLVYGLIVAEIAAKRGEFQVAFDEYYKAAARSGDPVAAERATHIARLTKNQPAVLKAVTLWEELTPDSVAAQRFAVVAHADAGNKERAVHHLGEMVRLVEAKGVDGYLQAGLVVAKLKDKALGLDLMGDLVKTAQDNPQAWYAYSVVAVGAEQYPLAETNLRKAIQLKGEWSQAQVLLSRILFAQGNKDEARSTLEQALVKNPDDKVVRIAYARFLVDIKDYETARKEFLALLEKDPDNADVLFASGILALQLEKSDEARSRFERLVKLKKRPHESAFYLGQIEEIAGNKDKAVHWYKRVKGRHLLDSRIRLARLYAESGNMKTARELLQQMRSQAPQESVRLYLVEGELLREFDDAEEALRLYDQALSQHPDHVDLLYARGLHAANTGHLDIMEKDFRKLLEKDANNADALNALGYTLADQTDRHKEALGYIKRALALKPESAAVLDSMGWVQYRLGNKSEAVKYLQKAMKAFPDAEIAGHLGEVLWSMGEKSKAEKIWDEGLELDPENKPLLDILKRHGKTGR